MTPLPSSSVSGFLFASNRRTEAEEFLKAVRDLQSSMNRLLSVNPASETLVRMHNLMQAAMNYLQSEFSRILKAKRDYLNPECVSVPSHESSKFNIPNMWDSEGEYNSFDGAGDNKDGEEPRFAGGDCEAMDDLKMIADCMISNGYTKECVRVYKTVRKSIVNETLQNFGVELLTSNQIQKMDWKKLESKIKSWLRTVKFAVCTLFYGEKFLAEHVLSASSAIAESSFTEITQEGALTLFIFPENAAKFKKLTPEKVFCILDMYEALADLFSEIASTFCSDSTSSVRSQVANSLARLGQSVRSMMQGFESTIQKDSSKKPIPGGGVHSLTIYVVNYLALLANYSASIAAIFENWELNIQFPLPESFFAGTRDDIANPEDTYSIPVYVRLSWLILLTLCKIDGKAQAYKDVALSYLFLTNNLQYVVVNVRSSKLQLLLGGNWVARHEAKVKQYADKFEKLAWGKVLASLPKDPTEEISPEEAKEKLKRINEELESVHRKQISWIVPDRELREEMKQELAGKVIDGYKRVYERSRGGGEGKEEAAGMERCRRPEEVGDRVWDMYEGTNGSYSSSSKLVLGFGLLVGRT